MFEVWQTKLKQAYVQQIKMGETPMQLIQTNQKQSDVLVLNLVGLRCKFLEAWTLFTCFKWYLDRLLLILSGRTSLSYRNQPINLQSKSMNRFLYDRDLCH